MGYPCMSGDGRKMTGIDDTKQRLTMRERIFIGMWILIGLVCTWVFIEGAIVVLKRMQ